MVYFIGIDIGGTVVKVGLYDLQGNEIGVESINENLLTPQQGYCERDMNLFWQNICQLLNTLISNKQITPSQIKGISFSAHGKGLYAIDKAGNPVRNGIISSDTRADDIARATGNNKDYQAVYNVSYQQLWPSHPAILLSWMKTHESAKYDKIDTVFMAHDYIRFKLTGQKHAELTNIAASNLVNQQLGAYDDSLFDYFNISDIKHALPPIIQSTELAGYITEESAALTGLLVGTPVYAGFFDVVSASVVSGVFDDTQLSVVLGTWSITTSVMNQITLDDNYPYIWGNYCLKDKFYVHEGTPTSASNLDWMLKVFFNGDTRYYEHFEQWASDYMDNPTTDIVFMPYLFASNTSKPLPATIFGLSANHELSDILPAVYHGIISSHLIHHKRILKINPNIKEVRLTGGPSQSKAWMQMFSDAFGLPVDVVDVKQSGCKGAAMCAAVGAGFYKDLDEAQKNMLNGFTRYEPRHHLKQIYDAHFDKFMNLVTLLEQH
ncbi:FGGY-family carbohydrate kinase [Thorsellia anophelis]|uniref:L-xylulokinase n=1 Tax=Thorsellia anophelis DSM 18579 TaxID=1123402 RepID=A0A1I0B902_9GAMM|nr:FGGY-family carbohydrate kinase [Thorsellia anophelis]SET03260.1 L-xylulokinase [Thorsellia anophelis DSM 18579]